MKHIGIVATSSEGAALCYRTICALSSKLLGKFVHPEISIHTYSFSEYTKHIESGNWNGVAELMVSSSVKLKKAGADFLICPCNTVHQVFEEVAKNSPLPWLHIAEVVAKEAVKNNFKYLGITGTKYLMECPVYPTRLSRAGIKHLIPDTDERKIINQIIFNELVRGKFIESSTNYFIEIIKKFKKNKCDAVVLGCTEIPLIINSKNSPLPVLDSTRLLAKAALVEAVEKI